MGRTITIVKKAKVYLKSTVDGMSTQEEDLEYDAVVVKQNENVYIDYVLDKQKTRIEICEEGVTICQIGEVCYTLCIMKDTKTSFVYTSPIGDIELFIGVETNLIEYNITDKGIDIHLIYTLSFDKNTRSENSLSLQCIYQ